MNELRHLVDPLDLSFEETLRLLDLADSIANDRTAFAHKCEGKILAHALLRAEYPHAPEL